MNTILKIFSCWVDLVWSLPYEYGTQPLIKDYALFSDTGSSENRMQASCTNLLHQGSWLEHEEDDIFKDPKSAIAIHLDQDFDHHKHKILDLRRF